MADSCGTRSPSPHWPLGGVLVTGVRGGVGLAMNPPPRLPRRSTMSRDEATGAISVQVPTKVYGDDAYPVWYRRPLPLDAPSARFYGFKPESVLLRKGEIRCEGALPLPCDIRLDRD